MFEVNEIVKDLIKTETGVDINEPSRLRLIVEMRSLYYKIVRELAPMQSYHIIGKSVNKDHASVIYGISQFELYAKYNKRLMLHYHNIKNAFLKLYDHNNIVSLEMEIQVLEFKIKMLKEKRVELINSTIIENGVSE
jgi:hypothetical protein